MNRKIFFCPVGGTDPISERNLHEGAMLHICRHYAPDEIYLYMSAEILANHKKDNRYVYCLDRLYEQMKKEKVVHIIERPDMIEVQDFDAFYEDIQNELGRIVEKMDDTDELYLNISSGTPAMKSTIMVLVAMGMAPGKIIQVKTPVRKMNEHIHTADYDVQSLWELNENNTNGENRCEEVKCMEFAILQQKKLIKESILHYDYSEARALADALPARLSASFIELLEMANDRYQLNDHAICNANKKLDLNLLPVRSEAGRTVFEYALSLQCKLKHEEYADFVRAITPLIVDLFEMILDHECGIQLAALTFTDRRNVRRWDLNRLQQFGLKQMLDNAYGGRFEGGIIRSDNILKIILHQSADTTLYTLVEEVRNIEEKVRNIAAHEIVSVTDAQIRRITGYSSEDIMKKLRDCFPYAGINVREEDWNSYDEMNKLLLEKL